MPIKYDGKDYEFSELVEKIKKDKPEIKSPGGYVKSIEENEHKAKLQYQAIKSKYIPGYDDQERIMKTQTPKEESRGDVYKRLDADKEREGKPHTNTGEEIRDTAGRAFHHISGQNKKNFEDMASGNHTIDPDYTRSGKEEEDDRIDPKTGKPKASFTLLEKGEYGIGKKYKSASQEYQEIKLAASTFDQVVNSFKNKKVDTGGNYHSSGDRFHLHGHKIAEHTESGLKVTDAGYPTHTTHKALRALGVNIRRQGGKSYINDKPYESGSEVEVPHSQLNAKAEIDNIRDEMNMIIANVRTAEVSPRCSKCGATEEQHEQGNYEGKHQFQARYGDDSVEDMKSQCPTCYKMFLDVEEHSNKMHPQKSSKITINTKSNHNSLLAKDEVEFKQGEKPEYEESHPFNNLDEEDKLKVLRECNGTRYEPPYRNPRYEDLDLVSRQGIDSHFNREKVAILKASLISLESKSPSDGFGKNDGGLGTKNPPFNGEKKADTTVTGANETKEDEVPEKNKDPFNFAKSRLRFAIREAILQNRPKYAVLSESSYPKVQVKEVKPKGDPQDSKVNNKSTSFESEDPDENNTAGAQ